MLLDIPARVRAKNLGVIFMLITLTGCTVYSEEFPIPGADLYSLKFDLDYDALESGTYVYGHPKSTARRLGGGVGALERFHPLKLNFKLKDGREIEQTIDTQKAIDALVESAELPNVKENEEGGDAVLIVAIDGKEIRLTYRLREDFKGPEGQFYFRSYDFPMKSIPLH
ncbi:MAG: hypothetical protein AAF197_04070 [Pseudomonadota bacterium]